jgi:hypothetical protein
MEINSFNQEFGYELLSSIPYSYDLYLQNKLTETESGIDTDSLYYFSPKHTSNSIKRDIKNTVKAKNENLPYVGIHTHERPELKFPPYKEHYKNNDYKWDKPTLCICNRYTTEWNKEPINYFDLEMLDWMFSKLKKIYHIVYFPVNIPVEFEDQEEIRKMNDIDIALKHNVNVFNYIKGDSWNESMLKVFANCEHYITMNGGYSILASLFGGTNIIYSKKCNELNFNSFNRWYPNHSNQRTQYVENYNELKNKITDLYIKKLPLVNIIINMSDPILFDRCIKSVLKQDYKNINIVVVTNTEDNIKHSRKYNIRHIHIDPLQLKNKFDESYINNVNINIVQKKVDGYIMIMNDADILLSDDSISTIMETVGEDKLLIWKTQMPGKLTPKNIKYEDFHNNICYHSKNIKLANWEPNKKSIKNIVKRFRRNVKYLDKVINKYDPTYSIYENVIEHIEQSNHKIIERIDKNDTQLKHIKNELEEIQKLEFNDKFDDRIMELVEKSDDQSFDDRITELVNNLENDSDYESVQKMINKGSTNNESEIAVILHLYYTDLLPEFISYLKNIKQDYDLYLTLVKGSPMLAKTINEIYKFKQDTNILLVENKGLDIGPAFLVMKNIIENGKSYKYYLKLHTKKSPLINFGETWRKELCKICVSEINVHNSLNLLKLDNVGMIANKKNICGFKDMYTNSDIVKQYVKKFNLSLNNFEFVGGTMFWVDGELWENFFKSINIDLEYSRFCNGSFNDKKEGKYTHSMERIFGVIVKHNKLKIIGI